METSLGTGFLITFQLAGIISVTAKHVANTLLPTGEVIMNLPKQQDCDCNFPTIG